MRYTNDKSGITSNGKDGAIPLTNFGCKIVRQIHRHDGQAVETDLVIRGEMHDGPLREIIVAASQFGSMSWVATQWGVKPIVYPHTYTELRTAIQETSSPDSVDVYTHTGWTQLGNEEVYLHAGGGLRATGNDPSITVDLPADLKRYDLGSGKESKRAFQASLRLFAIGPPEICVPYLLATYRAALGDTDFGLHLSGRTGTFKSELCSLWQSHFGDEMNARRLPGNWSSTAGSLEALAYKAKDALFVVDDFVPGGTAHHRTSLNRSADTLFRAQGNQAGRQRLTDTSNLQKTMFPRGLILSTGEDIPEGHSLRGRLIIGELSPGDISPEKLSTAQKNRSLYPVAMSGWIRWLAPQRSEILESFWSRADQVRDKNLGIGHSRTPAILGQLTACLEILLLRYAKEQGLISESDASAVYEMASEAILLSAKSQSQYLTAADPCTAFVAALHHCFACGFGHLRTRTGGIPAICRACGWTEIENGQSAYPSFKAHGPCLGWISENGEEIFIDANTLPLVAKHSQNQISLGPQTLIKRLKDGGLISRNESSRDRNTIRVSCAGLTRTCVAIRASEIFKSGEAQ